MPKLTEELTDRLKEKLEYVGLDLNNVPTFLKQFESFDFKSYKVMENHEYRVYRYIPCDKIRVLLTPKNKEEDLREKFKAAIPISAYLNPKKEEKEIGLVLLAMLEKSTIEQMEEIQRTQIQFQEKSPFLVKYDKSYLWQIYYAEQEDTYFMLVPSNHPNYNHLFYLLKKQIEQKPFNIYAPVCNLGYTSEYLRSSEIKDLENYLWAFTKNWPIIYEVTDQEGKTVISINGVTQVYEGIETNYRVILEERKQAQEFYKLIKALFLLQTEIKTKYQFQTCIDNTSTLELYYDGIPLSYDQLSGFIKKEFHQITIQMDKEKRAKEKVRKELKELNQLLNIKEEEYLEKQREIATYLECKKTFFGKVRYYFKMKKSEKKRQEKKEKIPKEPSQKETANRLDIIDKLKLQKEYYTIEDLIAAYESYKIEQKEIANLIQDSKSAKLKARNLESKIKNATIYISEIQKHKKSIFEFWKFANKDELKELGEGRDQDNKQNSKHLKRRFLFTEDFEDFGIKMDEMQRTLLTQEEINSVFIASQDCLDVLNQEIVLPEKLEQLKLELASASEAEFDILGEFSGRQQELKPLSNKKHREAKKSKMKVLDLSKNKTLENFEKDIQEIRENLETAMNKIKTTHQLSVFKAIRKKRKIKNECVSKLQSKHRRRNSK